LLARKGAARQRNPPPAQPGRRFAGRKTWTGSVRTSPEEYLLKKVALFWPGDYRDQPNEWARPQATETTEQLQKALKKLGRKPYVIKGFLTRPADAIARLGPVDDPAVGVFVHWTYAPHTCDGVVGKDSPLLLATNFLANWSG